MRSLLVSLCLFVFPFALAAPLSFDDLDHATLEGTLSDANGGALPGASITLKQTQTGQQRTATSKADGRYRLSALLPGSYELRVEASGFQTRHVVQ